MGHYKPGRATYDKHVLDSLVGRQVTAVHWSEYLITFETAEGLLSYEVEGDCCSHSYLHDFHGLDKLLAGPVASVGDVALLPSDVPSEWAEEYEKTQGIGWSEDGDLTQVYGYEIVTQHPQWGEVTTVFSFRNSSNGYYGGWMDGLTEGRITTDQRLLTEDVVQ